MHSIYNIIDKEGVKQPAHKYVLGGDKFLKVHKEGRTEVRQCHGLGREVRVSWDREESCFI